VIDSIPVVQPEEAIRFFRRKGYEIGFAWQDVWQDAHAHAFTVAKAMSRDLLQDIGAEVDRALAEGRTLDQFKADLRPKLEARGWWGKKRMIDPATGEAKLVQLGSPRRLKTIFQVNMRTSYMAGKWERIQRTKAAFPFLRYVSVMDGRERPQHHAWHGTIKPVGDPWWDTHYPPCGWNCRCTVQQLNQRTMDREGWSETEKPAAFREKTYLNRRTGEITKLEAGIDPGWAYNVGKASVGPGPIPPAPGGVVPATKAHVEAFLEPFGLKPGEERVWKDKEGFPHLISEGWLRDAGGELVVPSRATPETMHRAAQTMVSADVVAWRWIEARDGIHLLMRRFLKRGAIATRVDVGAAGWRMQVGDDEIGQVTKPTATLHAFIERAIAQPTARENFDLGPIGPKAARQLAKLGIAVATKKGVPKAVALEGQLLLHTYREHSKDSDGQIPIRPEDYRLASRILNEGRITAGDRDGRHGEKRFVVNALIDGSRYRAVYETRKSRFVLYTLFRFE
jgi:SPP1 gp7 family putative phage head morphogenesis protein